MGSDKLTYDQVISRLLEDNIYYKNKEFTIISKFKGGRYPLIVKDKYGYHRMSVYSLLKGSKPSSRSSLFPLNYLSNRLCELYTHFYKREVVLIGPYKKGIDSILVKDSFGMCNCTVSNLLKGRKPTILSAVDKTEYFINKSKKLYGDRFTYEKTQYKDNGDGEVIITCKKHGDFKTTPNIHMQSPKCSKCHMKNLSEEERLRLFKTSRLSTGDFINRAVKVHGDKYDYSLVKYTISHNNVDILCHEHGVFKQKANNHLNGSGCPACSNQYTVGSLKWWCHLCNGKQGILYILKCYNNDEVFIKIGITCNSIKYRYRKKTQMPYNYEVVSTISSNNLKLLYLTEAACKKKLKPYRYAPKNSFGGSQTEAFILNNEGYHTKENENENKFKDIEHLVHAVWNGLQLLEAIENERKEIG